MATKTVQRVLLIRTRNGVVHRGQFGYHLDMMLKLHIDPDDIVDTGWVEDDQDNWRGGNSREIEIYAHD